MKRKLLLTFILGVMALPLLAQDNVNKMKVVMTDGSEIVLYSQGTAGRLIL